MADTPTPLWAGEALPDWRRRHGDPTSHVWAAVPPEGPRGTWRLHPPGGPTAGVPSARARGPSPHTADVGLWDWLTEWVEKETRYDVADLIPGWPWPEPYDPTAGGQAHIVYARLRRLPEETR